MAAKGAPASEAFRTRAQGIPQTALEQLDKMQQMYDATSHEMMCAWDVLALSNSDWADAGWPKDELAVQALRKQLEANIAKKKKSRELPKVSTIKTDFSMSTPPPIKKRASEISPPPDAKRILSMDQMNSVASYTSPSFPVEKFVETQINIRPAGEWTETWFDKKTISGDQFLYMNASLETITQGLRSEIVSFGEDALKNKRIKSPMSKVLPVVIDNQPQQEPEEEFATSFDKVGAVVQSRNVVVCGRIVCESENGKLNAKSIMLEGTNGIRVKLDVDSLHERFSLFPGQHVVVEGTSTGSAKIRAERIYVGVTQQPPSLPESSDSKTWVASGPYTASSDLRFEFLDALLVQVIQNNPDVLILLGPFVDANHQMIASGRPAVQIVRENGEVEVINDLGFDDVFSFFLQRITTALKHCKTKVCLIPCTDDVTHSVMAFPQPNLVLPEEFMDDPRFISLSNPATISIGNVVFGIANIDTLFDFQDEGTAAQGYEPRENMARLTAHLLLQRSYYPIVPPSPESCVDVSGKANFSLPPVDILLVPSRLQSFAQNINGVLCINPGRSSTLKTKMTVARIEIRGCTLRAPDADGVERSSNVAKTRSKVDFFTVG